MHLKDGRLFQIKEYKLESHILQANVTNRSYSFAKCSDKDQRRDQPALMSIPESQKVVAAGGYNDLIMHSASIYSLDTDTWSEMP